MRKATLATVPRLQCKVSCICDHEMPALSMRERLSAFAIFRLMKKHGLLLQRYTGRRRPGEHDGKIITIRSNIRWCADALEFTAYRLRPRLPRPRGHRLAAEWTTNECRWSSDL
jgi:hypothetical protein